MRHLPQYKFLLIFIDSCKHLFYNVSNSLYLEKIKRNGYIV